MSFGPLDLILIALIVLLLFGASLLPRMGRGLGQGIRGFTHELTEGLQEDRSELEERREREAVTPRAAEPH
jgi:sec-independent protein translocase protein TatA